MTTEFAGASPPEWVEFDPDRSEGLDFLGLRAPAQALSNDLLDGVTTVTPRLRYVCLAAWLVERYVRARLPNNRKSFERFAASVETALTLANVLRDRSARMVGVRTARRRLEAQPAGSVSLDRLVQNIAFNIYSNAAVQLGVLIERSEDDEVHGLSEERGALLADAIAPFLDAPILKRVLKHGSLASATRSDLVKLRGTFDFDDLSAKEISLLRSILMPTAPRSRLEGRRLSTYMLLLWLGQADELSPEGLFALAADPTAETPLVLAETLDGWLGYCVRDLIAVAHEFVFDAVMHVTDVQSNRRDGPARPPEVLGELLGARSALLDALSHLKLVESGEKLEAISWRDMETRIAKRCARGRSTRNGLRRWQGGLTEMKLIARLRRDRAGAPALLPVAWSLAALRLDGAEPTAEPLFAAGGDEQVSLTETVLPRLERYRRENASFAAVMEDLVYRTVDQHLTTAWTRMARDNGKDISVLSADLDSWSRRAKFNPGQTDSRLSVAIGWLEQLGLVRDGRTIGAGAKALQAGLNTLAST